MPELTLEEIAARAKAHTMTPEERRAQRVSMIMGLRDSKSKLSREDIARLLTELEGQDLHDEKKSA